MSTVINTALMKFNTRSKSATLSSYGNLFEELDMRYMYPSLTPNDPVKFVHIVLPFIEHHAFDIGNPFKLSDIEKESIIAYIKENNPNHLINTLTMQVYEKRSIIEIIQTIQLIQKEIN